MKVVPPSIKIDDKIIQNFFKKIIKILKDNRAAGQKFQIFENLRPENYYLAGCMPTTCTSMVIHAANSDS